MVGEVGGHGWGARHPVMAARRKPEAEAQALMFITEVVEAADDIHAGGEGRLLLGQATGAAGEAGRRLKRPGWMPAPVIPTLPALYRDGVLASVPALAYPDPAFAASHVLRFASRTGAAN